MKMLIQKIIKYKSFALIIALEKNDSWCIAPFYLIWCNDWIQYSTCFLVFEFKIEFFKNYYDENTK